MPKVRQTSLILFLILILGTVVRYWHNLAIALWHDEAFSALLIRMPYSEMMHRLALDVHPPLYYWLLRAWSWIFNDSLLSLRSFSILFGVLSIWALYLLVSRLTQNKIYALGAAALLAVNALHIRYSLEARMYTLGTFLVIISSLFLILAVQNNRWRWWLAYGAAVAAMALTHYFLLFSIVGQGLFILVWYLRQKNYTSLRWIGAYVLSALLFLFWLPTFIKQFSQVQENYWIPKMAAWSIPDIFWKIFMRGFDNTQHWFMALSTVVFLIILAAFARAYKKSESSLMLFVIIAPFILSILASIKSSIFLDRYFIFASVFVTAVLAIIVLKIKPKILSLAVFVVLLVLSGYSYAYGLKELDPENRPGMAAAAGYVLKNFPLACPPQGQKNAKIVVGKTAVYFNYLWYHQKYLDPIKNLACQIDIAPGPKLYLPQVSAVSQIPHYSGAALLEDEDLVPDLATFAKKGETVFLIWTTGFHGEKPETPKTWQQLDEQKFPDVYQYRGEIFVTKYLVK